MDIIDGLIGSIDKAYVDEKSKELQAIISKISAEDEEGD